MSYEVFFYEGDETIIIMKWKVKEEIVVNQTPFVLFTYRRDNFEESKYKINKTGIIIKRLLKKNGDLVEINDPLFEYEICSHPTLMKDLCAVCGVNINKFDSAQQRKIAESTNVSMVHSIPELRVNRKIAEDLGRADEERLLRYRKLVLLVDLDQTIVHSTNQDIPPKLSDQIHHYQLYGPNSPWYHTKFRPYMKEFLEEISKYYELHICTFGARRYAHKIAHLIDPKCKFFPNDRILSRDEFFDPRSKTGNMNSLFPCGDSMVCIIDDRVDVWNNAPNVVQVKPYICFKTDDINAPEKLNIGFETLSKNDSKKSPESEKKRDNDKLLTENLNLEKDSRTNDFDDAVTKTEAKEQDDRKENTEIKKDGTSSSYDKALFADILNDNDDHLIHLKNILIRIHRKYYEEYADKMKYRCEGEEILIPDLKKIIPNVRQTVLHSINIVFSGVIATNIAPEFNRYFQLAKSLGAIITKDIIVDGSPRTTHLIAAKWGTTKVNRCLKYKQIKIVDPNWLLACGEQWTKVDEKPYLLTKETVYNIDSKEDYRRVHENHNQGQHQQNQIPSTSRESDLTMLELSPLSSFSSNDLNDMDKEVDDACSDDSDSSSSNENYDSNEKFSSTKRSRTYLDYDDESVSYDSDGEFPRGWSDREKHRRGTKRTNTVFDDDNDDDNSDEIKYDNTNDEDGYEEEEDDDDEDKEKKVIQNNESNYESSCTSSEAESIGSVDEEMAAALEKEFFQ